MDKIIKINDLKVTLNNKQVLKGINLDIYKGESIVIVGTSGCGKTVLTKTILGLIENEEGSVEIFGKNIFSLPEKELTEIKSNVGMVFQNSALFDSMNVWENVGFYYLYHTNKTRKEIKKMAEEILKAVGLENITDVMPEELSGGMKKRVSIARALISNPKILFYDEPTTGLDPLTADSITKLIQHIHKNYNTTDITVTHDVKLSSRISDRIALIEDGRITEIGTFEELREKTANPLIRSFVTGGIFNE
jgi:phospholipid/cholesterol/gamma-HCH transport system ATP-binding protein